MRRFKTYLDEAKKKKKPRDPAHFAWSYGDLIPLHHQNESVIQRQKPEEIDYNNLPEHYDDAYKHNLGHIFPTILDADHHRMFEEHVKRTSNENLVHYDHGMKYKQDSMEFINRHLRDTSNHKDGMIHLPTSGGEDSIHNKFYNNHVMEKMTNLVTPKGFTVYRGFRLGKGVTTIMKKGDMFHDHGFTGTSLDPNQTHMFADNDHHGRKITAAIHVTPGMKGHYLDVDEMRSDYPEEKEYLLHRGTQFKVLGHSIATSMIGNIGLEHHIIHMQTVHQHPLPVAKDERRSVGFGD